MCSIARRSLSRFGCLAGWGSLAYLLVRLLPGSRAPLGRLSRAISLVRVHVRHPRMSLFASV